MNLDLRSRLFGSQAAIMAAIMIVLALIMGLFLNQTLENILDQFLHQQADNFKATITISDNGLSFHDLNPDFKHSRPDEQEIPFHVQMLDINYRTLMLSGNLKGESLYQGGELPHAEVYETVRQDGDKIRRLVTPFTVSQQHVGWIIVTLSYHYLDGFRNRLWIIIGIATLVAVLLLTLSSFFFVRWSLRPVLRLAEGVNIQTEHDEFKELPIPPGDDEFSYLTRTFNGLLSKANSSLQTLERFSADASHELKTPLSVMRAELLRLGDQHPEITSGSILKLNDEISRMQQLIENLLILSQSDQPYSLNSTELWLNDFIADETSRIQQLSPSQELNFNLSEVDSIKINSDIYLLYLVYNNLLRNAVRYSPAGSNINIRCHRNEGDRTVSIAIMDSGPGIPEAELKVIFNRFYRIEGSRSRHRGGTGLGLSIAQWAAQKLDGEINLRNHPGGGLIASMTIPV